MFLKIHNKILQEYTEDGGNICAGKTSVISKSLKKMLLIDDIDQPQKAT